ncbi:ABC transporter substrate-binding protein [Acetobacter estunensis]|uniref:ABC transporter substrate-binding protein n=1 Tax=Acetobacter estunensis TaxID=104097 RepID=UPI001C2D93EE|nr:ABC transporter substrate-binding protein [Acetobacter estunensis]MBV1837781.1 ABC transporter substrate-binding protein [Acetobacter estunensis]
MQQSRILFLTGLLAATCAHADTPAPPTPGGVLRLAGTTSAGTLDPQISYMHVTYQVEAIVYDGLTTFPKTPGPADRHAIPDLADAIPAPQDNGLTYRFHLRPGIRFSNGHTVTAEDVAASMRRLFRVNSPTAGPYYSHIVGGDACLHDPEHCTLAGGVIADNATGTVTFHLTHPDSEFMDRLAFQHASILPADTPTHDMGNTAPIGTGPYRIVSYEPTSSMVLERNPYFQQWDVEAQPAGYPDSIHYTFGLDPESEVTAVENGQFDWMEGVPLDRQAEVGRRFAPQVRITDSLNVFYAALNVNEPPFNNLLARQALNYAVNRKAIVIYGGGPTVSLPACQMLPQGSPGFEPSCLYTKGATFEHPAQQWQAPDLEKARDLIRRSGTAGQHVTIIAPSAAGHSAVATDLRDTLTDLGYVASVRTISPVAEFAYIQNSNNKIQIGLTGWSADYPAASSFLQTLFSCATFVPHSDNSVNISQFCNHDIDALMQRAATVAVTDRAAGDTLWAEVSRRLMEQAPAVPLDQARSVSLLSSRVKSDVTTAIYGAVFSQFRVQ